MAKVEARRAFLLPCLWPSLGTPVVITSTRRRTHHHAHDQGQRRRRCESCEPPAWRSQAVEPSSAMPAWATPSVSSASPKPSTGPSAPVPFTAPAAACSAPHASMRPVKV